MTASVEWFDDLDAVAADAGGALDRARQPCLYDRLDWYRLTHSHILPGAKLAVVRVRSGTSSAWLFLIEPSPRRAAPLASWYTLRFAPVWDGLEARTLLAPLYDAVARRFDVLTLHPLARAEDGAPGVGGWRTFINRFSTNWTIDFARADFDAYWATRPSRLRNMVERRARSHPVSIAIDRHCRPEAWRDYDNVYADSWKPAEGSPAFLRALAEQESVAGTLRLGIARHRDGRAVAAQLWLVENGIATIHKLAHREDARAGSPGSLLTHAMFRSAIEEDRVQRIDFGLGDEPYKADWVDSAAPVWRIDAYRPATPRGFAGIAREGASRLARRLRGR